MIRYQQHVCEHRKLGHQRSVQDTVSTPIGRDVLLPENSVHLVQVYGGSPFLLSLLNREEPQTLVWRV